jgi:hypothetical protein
VQFTEGILLINILTEWNEHVAEHFWYIGLLHLLISVTGGSKPYIERLTLKILNSKSLYSPSGPTFLGT